MATTLLRPVLGHRVAPWLVRAAADVSAAGVRAIAGAPGRTEEQRPGAALGGVGVSDVRAVADSFEHRDAVRGTFAAGATPRTLRARRATLR